MDNNTFTRIFKLENANKQLTLYQQQVGQVNCVVWDAALVLAGYLDNLYGNTQCGINWLKGRKVLELGAGLGCVGMTAACLGAQVIMTDLDSAIPMLEKNVYQNKNEWEGSRGTVEVRVLQWGKFIDLDFDPELIVLADCVYYSESTQSLIDTLEHFCKNPDTYVILSQEQRDTPQQIAVWKKFEKDISKKFRIEYIPRSEQHPVYSSEDIYLIKLWKL